MRTYDVWFLRYALRNTCRLIDVFCQLFSTCLARHPQRVKNGPNYVKQSIIVKLVNY